MRAVLYMRLSAVRENQTGIDGQRAELRALCEREGWSIVEELVDDGISGAKQRANKDRALDLLRRREAEVLVVWKFDRLSRIGLQAVAELVEVVDNYGALFVAHADHLRSDQGATWRIVAALLAEIARAEREATQERIAASRRVMRSQLRWPAGRPATGYRVVEHPSGVGKALEPDPETAPIVHELFERVAGGESIRSVVLDLNARGIETRDGNEWRVAAARQILKSEAVLGRLIHKGRAVLGEDGMPVQAWEPLVSIDLWNAVQARLDSGAVKANRPRVRSDALLSGILVCAYCGSRLTYSTQTRGNPSYRCPGRSNGADCKSAVSVSSAQIEPYISELFLKGYGYRPEVKLDAIDTSSTRRAELSDAIARTLQEIGECVDDEEALKLTRRMQSMKRELNDLPATLEQRWVETGRTYGEVWETASTSERRSLLESVLRPVRVRRARGRGVRTLEPERVWIRWKLVPVRHPGGVTMAEHPTSPADDEEAWDEL